MANNTAKETLLLRPENTAFLRGEARVLPGTLGFAVLFIPVLGLAISAVCFGVSRLRSNERSSFEQNRAFTQGTIVSRRTSSTPATFDMEFGIVDAGEDTFLVTYRFTAPLAGGPRAFEREAYVPKEDFEDLKPGKQVTVLFDGKDPSVSQLRGEIGQLGPGLLFAGGIFTLALSLLLLAGMLVHISKDRRLCRRGVVLEGTIVDCTVTKNDEGGGQTAQVKFIFASPNTPRIEATTAVPLSKGAGPDVPTPGARIAVLYESDTNYRAL